MFLPWLDMSYSDMSFDRDATTLTWNDIYNCFVEILPSRIGRSRMYDIVSQDDGSGGSAECNNMEYGGYIDEYGFPIETQHGDVKSPCVDKEITINFPYGMKYATFHSHPSGIGNCENYIGEDGKPYMPIWQQRRISTLQVIILAMFLAEETTVFTFIPDKGPKQ